MPKLTLKEKKDLTKEEICGIIYNYILENIDLSSRKMRDDESFSSSSWSERQAFLLGQQKALYKMLDFIEPLTEEI